MRKKCLTTISLLVLLIVILSPGFMACTDRGETVTPVATFQETDSMPDSPSVSPSPGVSSTAGDGWLEVVYFHRASRCSGCIWAEETTTRTLETCFSEQLANGDIVYKIINLQDEVNADIVAKYSAHSSSLFVNVIQAGTENIEEIAGIWTKLHREEAFTDLVRSTIEEKLGNL